MRGRLWGHIEIQYPILQSIIPLFHCIPRLPMTHHVRGVIKYPRKHFNSLPQDLEHPMVLILLSDEKEDRRGRRANGVQHQCAVAAHLL